MSPRRFRVALAEQTRNTTDLQENRLKALRTQLEKAENRLSRLYDAHFDGEMAEETFKAKESEYRSQVSELKSQLASGLEFDPEKVATGFRTLELSKTLHTEFIRANAQGKAGILKRVASNFTLEGENLLPTYKKPFDLLAKGLSCSNWLPELDSN